MPFKTAPFSALVFALALALAAGSVAAQTIPDSVDFRNYFGTMTFHRPLLFAQYPGEDSAHIVLQQTGRIITVRRQGNAWVKTDSALIAVNGGTSGQNEQGMLGFAFHPQFAANGRYYVHYITGMGSGASLIAQRTAGPARRPLTSDPQTTVLRLTQPAGNHNGGSIAFGPDGRLYLAFGDGGGSNDANNLAQNLDTLFGKVLRIDVDGADAYPADSTRNYAIPSDNPFVGQAGRRPEIWAYGLRNPYRWTFHPISGHMWIGDVGQNLYEEISRVDSAGSNLGWRLREGAFCFNPSTGCPSAGLTPPVITMQRSQAFSITGGAFFTGDPAAAYHGVYIFGDWGTNHVWAMRPSGGTLTDSVNIGQVFNVASFDRDSQGRVFAVSMSNAASMGTNNGVVFILESDDMTPAPVSLRRGLTPSARPVRLSDVLRNPGAYEIHGLDGRALRRAPTGLFLVKEKGRPGPTRILTQLK